jgi:hypothetical protein
LQKRQDLLNGPIGIDKTLTSLESWHGFMDVFILHRQRSRTDNPYTLSVSDIPPSEYAEQAGFDREFLYGKDSMSINRRAQGRTIIHALDPISFEFPLLVPLRILESHSIRSRFVFNTRIVDAIEVGSRE